MSKISTREVKKKVHAYKKKLKKTLSDKDLDVEHRIHFVFIKNILGIIDIDMTKKIVEVLPKLRSDGTYSNRVFMYGGTSRLYNKVPKHVNRQMNINIILSSK